MNIGSAGGATTEALVIWNPGAGALNTSTTNQAIIGLRAIPLAIIKLKSDDDFYTDFYSTGVDLTNYNFTLGAGAAFTEM